MSARVIARVRAVRANRDAGISLTELLITLGLSTIIGAMTLGMFINLSAATDTQNDRAVSSAGARNALQAWASYLRVADGPVAGNRANRIEWLTSRDMLFYAGLNNRSVDTAGTTGAPTMVWLRRDAAGSLVEEFFPATATSGTAPTGCRTLLSSTSSAVTLFSATDFDRNAIAGDLGTAPTATTGCVPLPVTPPSRSGSGNATVATRLQTVYGITMDVVVRNKQGSKPIEFTTSAVMPPLGGAS